ncbi:hypothetical protein HIM_07461 [Hirsutella minnesotensis 3608]|uniref:CCHC-type domain-containing protein n=1 Tax=Hirsutella minnesotensis 3608 TaxID=1043627 RepID=A0A0F7ZYU4_9HYPO|nr:hypothetical protein HIM_07461 [Hirsutella minnesotensis 3608]
MDLSQLPQELARAVESHMYQSQNAGPISQTALQSSADVLPVEESDATESLSDSDEAESGPPLRTNRRKIMTQKRLDQLAAARAAKKRKGSQGRSQRAESVGQQAKPTSNVASNGAQGTQSELGEIRQQLDQQIDHSRRQGEQIQQLLSVLLEKSGEHGSRRRRQSRSPECSPPPLQRIREQSPIYEPKNKNQVQIQQFRGTSAAELSTFVGTLQWVFREHPRHYRDEQRRIRLAAGHLSQTLRRDFLDNLQLKFDGSEENMTWGDMEDWLWSNINNPRGRTRNAYTALTKLKQKPQQSFRDFFRQYRAIESEFPHVIPDWLRIEMFLFCCNKDIKDLFRSQNYPKSWNDLVEKGHEYDDDFLDKGYQYDRDTGLSDLTNNNGRVDASASKEKLGGCYKCGKHGHIRPKCTEPDCKRCGDSRHTTARHSDPATGANGVRRVQQEPEDED